MKKIAPNRKCIAWLLLITFMSFWGIKALHYHKETHSAEQHKCQSCPESPGGQCLICDFTISPFICQAESFHVRSTTPAPVYEQAIYTDKVYKALLYPYYLHAPPTRF